MQLERLKQGLTHVLGFGREGRALEDVVLRRLPDARVEVICDRVPDIAPKNWPLKIGPPDERLFASARVLRSPGVPVDHPVLVECRQRAIPVTGISSLWFAERPQAQVIGVTGSKGKSTTAALIAHLLQGVGQRAVLAGNIGVPLIRHIDTRADWFVVELSSYQLADLEGQVSIGVLTRLFPEHVDWHGSLEAYYAAKLRLAALVDGRPIWINSRDRLLVAALSSVPNVHAVNGETGIVARADGIWNGPQKLLDAGQSPLPGRHNLDNIALALSVVASICGNLDGLVQALGSFEGLPHRLQSIPGPEDVAWINDSISTTPYATRAALEACPQPPVLIAGGLERKADWHVVIDFCRRLPLSGLVVLPDNGKRIAEALLADKCVASDCVVHVESIEQAVDAAAGLVSVKGIVLLSPGAPSFPHYRDFEERGRRFAAAVLARR
ncbi:MAG: UDP-N-acetylmuramoyl-L-alanine--D-glutamate ligase [Wenzhouxiangellaceae bacterium]|nr:UDP-N-acetylmuramoyl-L-alanine--D-glutamate ligase [Wenzhouxiangellaceae bacterium]